VGIQNGIFFWTRPFKESSREVREKAGGTRPTWIFVREEKARGRGSEAVTVSVFGGGPRIEKKAKKRGTSIRSGKYSPSKSLNSQTNTNL